MKCNVTLDSPVAMRSLPHLWIAVASISPLPGANRLTHHVFATPEQEQYMIGESCPAAADNARGHPAWQLRAGHDQSREGSRAGSSIAPAHRAPHRGWPHVEQCESQPISTRAASRHRMAVDGFRCRLAVPAGASALPPLPADRPLDPGVILSGVKNFSVDRETCADPNVKSGRPPKLSAHQG